MFLNTFHVKNNSRQVILKVIKLIKLIIVIKLIKPIIQFSKYILKSLKKALFNKFNIY